MLRSRAKKTDSERLRGPGGGRHYACPLIRQALYEWFVSIRYAIDWHRLVAINKSKKKKNLCRFPRSILRVKVETLKADYARACLLNGQPVRTFKPDSWWFARWQEEYGLSMRKANRKYAVPRKVAKQRLEIFWVVLFRIRYLIQ